MKHIFFYSAIFIAIAFTSCKKIAKDFSPNCSGAAKSFNTDVLPVFQANCVSCHSSYSNYANISASKTSIRSKIVDGSMPTKKSLSDAQKNAVICWIDNGAPNN
jgi:hypothetical protein